MWNTYVALHKTIGDRILIKELMTSIVVIGYHEVNSYPKNKDILIYSCYKQCGFYEKKQKIVKII